MGSALGQMEIPWGHPIKDILEVLRVFMLDLEFLDLDCAAGLKYAERFIVGSFVPLMLIFTYGVEALVLVRFLQVRDAAVRCFNTSGMGMRCFFVGLMFHGVEPFLGFQHPNEQFSMRSGQEVIFYEER